MNIHPLFVHFPIGILVLYTAFEIVRLKVLTRQPFYFPINAILSILGAGAAVLTASTGEMAEHIVLKNHPEKKALIEMHSMFAGATIGLYAVIAAFYLFTWLAEANICPKVTKHTLVLRLVKFLGYLVLPFSILGLIAITITGGLGATIVYGPEVDPFVTFIYGLFF